MNNALTVAELIEVLARMPQDMPVMMSMNQEYDSDVEAYMVNVETDLQGNSYVCINDCPDME